MTAHNFTQPHHSLKRTKIKNIIGNIWKKYEKVTPMMSIKLTDHVWTLKELLTFPYHKNISR